MHLAFRLLSLALLLMVALEIPFYAFADSPDSWVTSDGSPEELSRPQNEPTVAVHPADHNVVVAGAIDRRKGLDQPWPGFYNSTDAGATWRNQLLPIGPFGRPFSSPERQVFGGDPIVAFSPTGDIVYYASLIVDRTISSNGDEITVTSSIHVTRTRDLGDRFEDAGVATATDGGAGSTVDKPWMAVDRGESANRGSVYVCWTIFTRTDTGVHFSRSRDQGVTWSSSGSIGSDDEGAIGCSIAIGNDGTVYVAWLSRGVNEIQIVKSTDGGQTFSAPRRVSSVVNPEDSLGPDRKIPGTRLRVGSLPTVAVDDQRNYVYVAWTDNRDAATEGLNVLFTKSTDINSLPLDRDATWEAPRKVHDDTLLSGDTDGKLNDQLFPAMSVAMGVLTIGFYDRRGDPTNTLVDLFISYSLDGGVTFKPNIMITDTSSDPTIDSGSVEDYITIASVPTPSTQSLTQFVWTDTRDPPSPDVGRNQDTWTDRLILGGGGTGSPYVYVWNGTGFSLDNNLLPASARGYTGTDLTDWYLLQKPLVKDRWGHYNLMVRELESDHSFFDQTRLWAVDHLRDVNVAVTPSGRVLTYQNPVPPVTAVDEAGKDATHLLSSQDGIFYESSIGSYLVLDFGYADVTAGAKLVLRADPSCSPACKMSILVQTLDSSGAWQTVDVVIPRVFWSIDIVDLSGYLPDPNGELKVRLYFTLNHRLDFAGLDTSPNAPIDVYTQPLLLAWSTAYGDLTSKLVTSDDDYGELLPEQALLLVFDSTSETREARSFIIVVEGYYIPLSS